MQPRFKDKDIRIEEIQKAAKEVFFKKGFLSATIDDVAKEAQIAKGTVYLYFKNKDDLYMSLMEPATNNLLANLVEFNEALELRDTYGCDEIVMGSMKCLYDWYENDVDGFNVTTIVHQGGLFSRMSSETLERLNVIGRRGFDIMRRIFSKAKEAGTIKQDLNEAVLADMVYATFLGIVQYAQSKKRTTHKDYILQTLEGTFKTISAGIAANPRDKRKGKG